MCGFNVFKRYMSYIVSLIKILIILIRQAFR
jgi:hypothetical protein